MGDEDATQADEIVGRIKALGGLHDAKLTAVSWHAADRRFEIEVEDIYSNFGGLPEYKGPHAARFVFLDVGKLEIAVGNFAIVGLLIFEWTVARSGSYISQINLSPGGKILIASDAIECIEA